MPTTKARRSTESKKGIFRKLGLPLGLLTIAAISSPISQATLAPVFGAIPSSVNHKEAVVVASLLGFLLRWLFKGVSRGSIAEYAAAWSFWIPVVQHYLFNLSGALGPQGGPALIGFLSCHTILLAATYTAAACLEDLKIDDRLGAYAAPILTAAFGASHVVFTERFLQAGWPGLTAVSSIFTPVKAQLLLASTFSYLAPSSKLRLLAIPALIHAFLANPHFDSARTFEVLNKTLHTHNWTILDRQWSNTGYMSVLESLEMEYRVLRCDHSILGGEWQLTDERRKEGWQTNESIYAAFAMMEAVRLIELESKVPNGNAKALMIGLGIGTAPKAFITHGINTTVVELDPAVHEYATKYFDLPTNHTAVIGDAVEWLSEAASTPVERYDYIIHDVFTGGAEPLPLFTDKFLQDLRSLLKPDGAIALNYAGDLSLPLTRKVLNTIDLTFNSQCKIYPDTPPTSTEDDDNASINGEFANMVVFCRNKPGPISFRMPTEADFLGSKSRESYMLPDPTFEIQFPLQRSEDRAHELPADILKQGEESNWAGQQAKSSTKHWHIMRKVLPDAIWELW